MSEDHNHQEQIPNPDIIDALLICWGIVVLLFLADATLLKWTGKVGYILIELSLLAFVWIYLGARRYRQIRLFRWRSIPQSAILVMILIAIGTAVLFDELDRLVGLVIPMPVEQLEALKDAFTADNAVDNLLIAFGVVIIGPLVEESLFRGVIQQIFERRWDITRAILLTSLIFALIHLQPWWIIQQLILAVFLGYLSWRWNSIIPAFLIHAANNAWALRHIMGLDDEVFSIYLMKGHVNPIFIIISAGLIWFAMRKAENLRDNQVRVDGASDN